MIAHYNGDNNDNNLHQPWTVEGVFWRALPDPDPWTLLDILPQKSSRISFSNFNAISLVKILVYATTTTFLIEFSNVPIPLRLARFSMAPVGSEPMERKQMSGV